MKHVGRLVIDSLLLILITVILLIVFIGGFDFEIGSLPIKATHLKNPSIGLIVALILRKLFTGTFFKNFPLFLHIPHSGIAAIHFTRRVCTIGIVLVVVLAGAIFVNPLQRGLQTRYYENAEWASPSANTIREDAIHIYRLYVESLDIHEPRSIQWKGVIQIDTPGEYGFTAISNGDVIFSLDDQSPIHNQHAPHVREKQGAIHLETGFHTLDLRYAHHDGHAEFTFLWKLPGKRSYSAIPEQVLFQEAPDVSAWRTGRILEGIAILCQLLLALSILIGLCHQERVFSWLRASRVGRKVARFKHQLLRHDLPERAVPLVLQHHGIASTVFAFIGYALLTLIWTYPLITKFSTEMVGWGGDRYIYLWNMWWLKKALLELHTNPLFTQYLFYPDGISLAFHDFSLLLTTLALPLQWLFSLQEIYNLFFLLSFALAGLGCFLLVRYLTGDVLAAFLAGVVFAFWGGRAYYTDHFYLAAIQWLPFCALFLIKTLREPSWRHPILAAVFLTLNALTSWVYAVFISIFAGLFFLYATVWESHLFWRKRTIAQFLVMGLLFLLCVSPVVMPMVADMLAGQEYMNAGILPLSAAALNTLLLPGVNHPIWGDFITYHYLKAGLPIPGGLTGGLFIGYVVIILCVYAIVKLKHLRHQFWTVGGLIFLLLAMGPNLQIIWGKLTNIPLLYGLLEHAPVLKTVRVPERFMVMVLLCCSVLVGYAAWDILRHVRYRKIIFGILVLLTLGEHVREFRVKPLESTSEFYRGLGQDIGEYAILELTQLTELSHAARRSSLFQIAHEKKLFNGFVARVSPDVYIQAYRLHRIFDDLLSLPQHMIAQPDRSLLLIDQQDLLTILDYYRVRYVALYHDYRRGTFRRNKERLAQLLGEPLAKDTNIYLYLFAVDTPGAQKNVAFPGRGMFPLQIGASARLASREADIRVLNVEGSQSLNFRFQGRSPFQPELHVRIFVNDQLVDTVYFGDAWQEVHIDSLALQPGENVIQLRMPDVELEDSSTSLAMKNIQLDFLP